MLIDESMLLIEVDDTRWPFVVSALPPNPTLAFFEVFFAKQAELLSRRQLWVHVVDLRLITAKPDATVRNAIAEHTTRLENLSGRYNAGTATIFASSIVRGFVTAIHWLRPPPHPFLNTCHVQEAVDFTCERLRSAQIAVPPRASAAMVDAVSQRVAKKWRRSGATTLEEP